MRKCNKTKNTPSYHFCMLAMLISFLGIIALEDRTDFKWLLYLFFGVFLVFMATAAYISVRKFIGVIKFWFLNEK